MFQKIIALLWKDLSYRFHATTFITFIFLILFGFAANLHAPSFSCCEDGYLIIGSFKKKFETTYKCASSQVDNLGSKILAYEPSTSFLRKLMEDVACLVGFNKTNIRIGLDKEFDFGIRFNGIKENQTDPPESLNYDLYPTFDPEGNYKSPIERAITRAFYRGIRDDDEFPRDVSSGHCLRGTYRIHYRVLLPFFMFFLESDRFLSCIIKEKNAGIQELLKVMGVKIRLIRLSAFFISIMMHLLAIAVVLIFLHAPIEKGSVVYYRIGASTMFFYFISCAFYISAFIYMGSFFFQNGQIASLLNAFLWISSVIFFAFAEYGAPVSIHTLKGIAFIPQFWCVQGFVLLSKFERQAKTVGAFENVFPEKNYITVQDYFLIGVFVTIIYMLLGVYLENVFPGKYGRSLPFYYCFTKSYWAGEGEVAENIEVTESEGIKPNQEFFEEKPRNLTVGISVQNLTKIYEWWKKKITKDLDNVTFDVYEGEITGLLGHNGAGKTTLISILCGMIPATSGKVTVNGIDIQVRSEESGAIGYCPQFDILLDGLTVYKNLIFFGLVKNMSWTEAAEEANSLIQKVGLGRSKTTRASNLSGGQRRKLSLVLALIGDSPVLILDEPTSGIDVSSRRDIWELLLKLRGEKTIIVSTHLMEEADALCDRIVFLDHGQVKSYGTPLFLKSKLGSGYTLSVVVANEEKMNAITDLVKKQIKGGALKHQNVLMALYQLPEKEMPAFPNLFQALENKKRNGEIVSYSVAVSTMEDVFLNMDKVTKEDNAAEKGIVQQESAADSSAEEAPKKRNLKGILLLLNQLGALLIKKWIFLKRNFILFIFLAAAPLAFDAIFDNVVRKMSYDNSYLNYSDGYCKYFESGPRAQYFQKHSEKVSNFKVVPNEEQEVNKTMNKKDLRKYYDNDYRAFELNQNNYRTSYYSNSSTIYSERHATYKPSIISNSFYKFFLKNGSLKASLDYDKYLKSNGPRKIKQLRGPDEDDDEYYRYTRYYYDIEFTPLLIFRFHYFFLIFFFLGISQEYESHLKTIQLMLVSPIIYWLSHILFDFPLLVIHTILSYIILGSSDEKAEKFMIKNLERVVIGLLFHPFCLLLVTYIVAKTTRRIVLALLYIVIYFLLGVFFSYLPYLLWIRFLFPTTLLFYHTGSRYWVSYYCRDWRLEPAFKARRIFFKDNCSFVRSVTPAMIIYVLLLPLFLILLDNKILPYICHQLMSFVCCMSFKPKPSENGTVESEEEKIKDLKKRRQLSTKVLVVDRLRRGYSCTKFAVQGVSFTVAERECFALLGVNGAGKTTVFKVLTGMILPTRGNAYVRSSSVLNFFNRYKIFSKMGYCSQFSNNFPNFKGREMIELCGRLRGMRGSQLRKEVDRHIQMSYLQEYERKRCSSYSGGTLRKLAVIMAMIGEPIVLLLDEPTTGIDPPARRSIWDLIIRYRDDGHSVLLTTHSMEECEALCSRLGIMIKGQLRCIGDSITLKNLFGQTYSVLLKISMKATNEDRINLKKAMIMALGLECQLTDEHLSIMRYQIPMESANWEKLFSELKSMKSKYSFLEYFSASSTTLEQVFLYFMQNS